MNCKHLFVRTSLLLLLILLSLVTGLFSPVILLNQQQSPPLRLQVSHCSTFRIMCDPSVGVFCSESIECFPDMAYKYSFQPFVTISVAPITTVGIILHFRFHSRCISTAGPLLFSFLIITSGLFAVISVYPLTP